MASFQQLQQHFAQSLKSSIGAADSAVGVMSPALASLIDALPYYGDTDFEAAHRGALTNLLAVNMPNSGIASQPVDVGYGFSTTYSYTGPYSGYQAFFFSGISLSSSAANVANAIQSQNGNINGAWWGNYAVAVLTDAVRLTVGATLDTGKLAGDLSNYNSGLLSCLAASYYGVYQNGFAPTASALSTIANAATPSGVTPFYSLVSTSLGFHFYTTSPAERDNAVARFGFTSEGIACFVLPAPAAGAVPLHRLAHGADHFYTTSDAERDNAIKNGFTSEGEACYVYPTQANETQPLHRLYNRVNGTHFYTTSDAERDNAIARVGFTSEGEACYVFTTQMQQACAELQTSILSGQFTANINEAIAFGGDSTAAAVWFLFNLWITLKALGSSNVDVDAAISQFSSKGLTVPPEVGPQSWWQGGYTSWYAALSGSDLAGPLNAAITAGLPELQSTVASTGAPGVSSVDNENISVSNGYSTSLCYWGGLNWYTPPSSSCFGKGTGVLMADGSVRSIEDVHMGDEVRTTSGTARVMLVESPPRAHRTLYRINGLRLYATAAHPFRAVTGGGAARYAIAPWTLADTVPTMIFEGVDALEPGSRLMAIGPNGQQEVTVRDIERLEPEPGDNSSVYDLILERAQGKIAAYLVGGPDTFLAIDAETSDGLREPMATTAIVRAMETAIESCRKAGSAPRLAEMISRLDLGNSVPVARAAAWSATAQAPVRLSVPGPDFFLQDGKWDIHASMLETYLVRKFARMARREAAMGWRSSHNPAGHGEQLTIVVHDLHFVDVKGTVSTESLQLELRLRGRGGKEDVVRELTLAANGLAHARLANSIIDFGGVQGDIGPTALIGTVTQIGRRISAFRTDILAQPAHGVLECFLFAPEGHAIGQVALEPRIGSSEDSLQEQQRSRSWTQRNAFALAQSLGQQIGAKLAATLEEAGPGKRRA